MASIMAARARRLRKDMTDAETKLWKDLRLPNDEGYHFRRQAPVGPFIADFVEHRAKLVIECDGDQHGEVAALANDARRDAWFADQGYRVIRASNHEVLQNIEGVIHDVLEHLGITPWANTESPSRLVAAQPQAGRPVGSPSSPSKRQRRKRIMPNPRVQAARDGTASPPVGEVARSAGGGDATSRTSTSEGSPLPNPAPQGGRESTKENESARSDCTNPAPHRGEVRGARRGTDAQSNVTINADCAKARGNGTNK